jgi:hypothetical protein
MDAPREGPGHKRPGLTSRERYLIHQVHPLKLATDISASVASDILFWQHRLLPGLFVMLVPSVAVSTLVLRGDLDRSRDEPASRYVLHHMPAAMQTIRAVSAVITAVGAWRRSPGLITAGYLLTALGWSHGALPRGIAR